jgi:hypothetical protein
MGLRWRAVRQEDILEPLGVSLDPDLPREAQMEPAPANHSVHDSGKTLRRSLALGRHLGVEDHS